MFAAIQGVFSDRAVLPAHKQMPVGQAWAGPAAGILWALATLHGRKNVNLEVVAVAGLSLSLIRGSTPALPNV